MYSGENIGPKVEPWGTSALTEYFCEDFPSRTTWTVLYWEKKK